MGIGVEENDLLIKSQQNDLQLKHPSQLTPIRDLSPYSLQLETFPNPTRDIINIASEVPLEKIKLWNPLGQLIYEHQFLNGQVPYAEWSIDVQQLSRGFYLLEVEGHHHKGIKKVLLE